LPDILLGYEQFLHRVLSGKRDNTLTNSVTQAKLGGRIHAPTTAATAQNDAPAARHMSDSVQEILGFVIPDCRRTSDQTLMLVINFAHFKFVHFVFGQEKT